MADAVGQLIEILDLEELEVNVFRGRSPQENRQRVFGGQVAGQALVAAGRTVDRGVVHSLHAYFLRPGDPTKPIRYQVDRIRDGRTFTTRRVVAIQHGNAIFNLAASFQPEESGPEHQGEMPEAPDPETLPDPQERLAQVKDALPREALEWLPRPAHRAGSAVGATLPTSDRRASWSGPRQPAPAGRPAAAPWAVTPPICAARHRDDARIDA